MMSPTVKRRVSVFYSRESPVFKSVQSLFDGLSDWWRDADADSRLNLVRDAWHLSHSRGYMRSVEVPTTAAEADAFLRQNAGFDTDEHTDCILTVLFLWRRYRRGRTSYIPLPATDPRNPAVIKDPPSD